MRPEPHTAILMNWTWQGVFPAITTAFRPDGELDEPAIAGHVRWMLESGCDGIICAGSLGEGATLDREEKRRLMRICVEAAAGKPVVMAVSSLSTRDAVGIAEDAERAGCQGLMVLPPYAYSTDWREMRAHVEAVFRATGLSGMLYNNPIAYKTDFMPEHIAELAADIPNLHAVKESSADIRRIAAIRALIGDRLRLLVGVDDGIVEALRMGADGWVAGLVNAFPVETVRLVQWHHAGRHADVDALYRWFLPLLRLDVVPKFVQLIKLNQEVLGRGSARVRPPRLELAGAEREEALRIIEHGIANRPTM